MITRRLSLKLDNQTRYDTAGLRALIMAGLQACGAHGPREVTVRYGTGRSWAAVGEDVQHGGHGVTILMRVDRWEISAAAKAEGRSPRQHPTTLNVLRFAQVLEHEIAHTMGLRHPEMTRALLYCEQPVPWADGFTVGVQPEPAKPSREAKRASSLAHAQKMLAKAERRLKIAQGVHKRWSRRVKFYSRQELLAGGVA